MAEYHLLTIWRIEAPLEEVYAAVQNSLRWPEWWPGVQKAEQVSFGNADGIGSIWRYSWQGRLPYRLRFEVCATRIEKLVSIEGTARGDLEGIGRWTFSREETVSVVRCEWHVRSTRWWMNLIAPLARSLFIRNHSLIMEQGGKGLARLLGSSLVSQKTIDLMAKEAAPPQAMRGNIDPATMLIAGIGAGILATLVQLALWWLTGMPLAETLFRDARLTAAMAMGTGVLPPPSTLRWDILLVATLIHFALSIAYAVIPACLFGHLRSGSNLLAGAIFGLIIYLVNLHGFTMLFPWFAVTRGWITLVAHLVFGIALSAGCRIDWRACSVRYRPDDRQISL